VPTVQPSALPIGLSASWLRASLSAAWLLASCPCPACLDPRSGQRLVSVTDLPAGAWFGEVTEDADSFIVTFEPDGHRAVVSTSWLAAALAPAAQGPDGSGGWTEDAKRLWVAADFPAGPPPLSWDRYRADAEHGAACLGSLLSG
jgi:gamma-butyrobetaine dioxygenase